MKIFPIQECSVLCGGVISNLRNAVFEWRYSNSKICKSKNMQNMSWPHHFRKYTRWSFHEEIFLRNNSLNSVFLCSNNRVWKILVNFNLMRDVIDSFYLLEYCCWIKCMKFRDVLAPPLPPGYDSIGDLLTTVRYPWHAPGEEPEQEPCCEQNA